MGHVRGAPYHPQTQGKIERWHQTLKNRILLENYFFPADLEAQIETFVDQESTEAEIVSLGKSMHRSKPMNQIPWRFERGDFPPQAGMEVNNYGLMEMLINRIPSLDHRAAVESGLLSDMPMPGASPDPEYSPKRRKTVVTTETTPLGFLVVGIGAFVVGLMYFS